MEEIFSDIGCFLERNAVKCLTRLVVQTGMSVGSVYWVVRCMKLHPCKVTVAQKLTSVYCGLGFISKIGCYNPCMMDWLTQKSYYLLMKHDCI